MQLRHNKRKSAAIKDLLTTAAAGEVGSRPSAGAAGRQRSTGAPAAVLQDVLEELLHAGTDVNSEADRSWVAAAGTTAKTPGIASNVLLDDDSRSENSSDGDEAGSLLATLGPMLSNKYKAVVSSDTIN